MKDQSAKQQQQQAAAAAAAAQEKSQEPSTPQPQESDSNQPESSSTQPEDSTKDQDEESTPKKQEDKPAPEQEEEESEAEETEEESEDEDEELYRKMIGKKVNDSGEVIDKKTGAVIGRLAEGKLKKVIGRKVGERGAIVNSKGKTLGRVEPVDEESSSEEESDSDSDDDDDDEEAVNNEEEDDEEEDAEEEEEASEAPKNKSRDISKAAESESEDVEDKAKDATDKVGDLAEEATDKAKDAPKDVKDTAEDATEDATDKAEDVKDTAENATEDAGDKAEDVKDTAEDATEDVKDTAEDATEEATDKAEDTKEETTDKAKDALKDAKDTAEDATEKADDKAEDATKEAGDKAEDAKDTAEDATEGTTRGIKDTAKDAKDTVESAVNEDSPVVMKSGKIFDAEDNLVGTVDKRLAKKLAGLKVDNEGNVYDEDGEVVGTADMIKPVEEEKPFNPNELVDQDSPEVKKSGKVVDMEDNVVGSVDKRIAPKLAGFKVDSDGNVINNEGHIVAKAEMIKNQEEEEAPQEDESDQEDKPFNPNEAVNEDSPEVRKSGKIFDMDDNLVGSVDKELAPKLAGFKVDKDGNVINNEGHIVARAEMIKEEPEEESEEEDKPFNPNDAVNEDSPEVKKSGKVVDMEDNVVGSVDKDVAPKLAGFKVDKDGNVINNEGHIVAKAEMIKEEVPEEKPKYPNDSVDDDSAEVKKSGKVFDMDDNLVGTLDKRIASKYAGCKVDPEGNVYDEDGHIVAKAEMIKEEESEEEDKPFNPNEAVNENSPEVRKSGKVVDMEDNIVGSVDKDVAPKLAGFKVDKDGNVINNEGHIVAKAEMIKEEEPEEEKPKYPNDVVDDESPEIRKSGKVFDMDDNLVGHVDKRMASKYAGCKVDPEGNIIDQEGHIAGKAEMIKKEEEEKEFNPNRSVTENSPEIRKSGKIFDMDDNLVGQASKDLGSKYAGCKVDPEGNIIDKDGHNVGKGEMIKAEDKPFNPNQMVDEDSPEVKKSGKVFDMDDNLVGHVDRRIASKYAGCKVDPEGNVINKDGDTVGKAEMIKQESESESESEEEQEDKPFNPNNMVDEHSPEVRRSGKVVDEDDEIVGTVDKGSASQWAGFKVDPYGNVINHEGHTVGKAEMIEQLSDEDRQKKEEEKQYREIADHMSHAIQQSLDKIKPVLKQITDNIEAEEAKSEKDRDEKKLVETVKPLIEQGSQILGEAHGAIRGLDPSGKIAKQAQARTSERKALPEEYHLAELLSQLTGEVSTTIDKAKKKIKNMPHAKKELGPLWNILQSPLLQILSAVGLLLTGVLGLVGNILNGLGLGSIVNSLLGGLGLNKILEGFGLGDALKLGSKK